LRWRQTLHGSHCTMIQGIRNPTPIHKLLHKRFEDGNSKAS
jgi:hypothetical protein